MNKLSTNKEFTFRWSIVPTTPSHWATVTSFRDRGDIFPPANLFVYFDGKMQTAYIIKMLPARNILILIISRSMKKSMKKRERFGGIGLGKSREKRLLIFQKIN